MSARKSATMGRPPIQRLLEPAVVASLLRGALPAVADEITPRRVRVERCWPGRAGEFRFEWSVAFGRQRWRLFGAVLDDPAGDKPARYSGNDGPCGVLHRVPEWGLLIYSPDRDAGLHQLAICLDPDRAARHLQPYWQSGAVRVRSPERLKCRLLGYRAGKRAAIGYCRRPPGGQAERLLGKTFRDGRGAGLLTLQAALDEQLCQLNGGRIRVPAPVGFVPELKMMLCSWVTSTALPGGPDAEERFEAAVAALAALHRTSPPDLPAFGVEDECRIVDHWQDALAALTPDFVDVTGPLQERLHTTASALADGPVCTIHRDFYDRQIGEHGKTVYLFDLDTVARGAAAVDLGNLLAHLVLARLIRHEPAGFDGLARRVVHQYQVQAGAVDLRLLRFYSASALFRVGAVHALRSATRQHAPALWALAGCLLAEPTRRLAAGRRAVRPPPAAKEPVRSATI